MYSEKIIRVGDYDFLAKIYGLLGASGMYLIYSMACDLHVPLYVTQSEKKAHISKI